MELLAAPSPDRDEAIEAALRNCLTESNLSVGLKTVVRTAYSEHSGESLLHAGACIGFVINCQ